MTIVYATGAPSAGPQAYASTVYGGSNTTVLYIDINAGDDSTTGMYAKSGGETRLITAHDSTIISVSPAFTAIPTYITIHYAAAGISEILINSGKDSGTATAGSLTTLTAAKAWTVDAFKESVVWITGGTGVGQSRLIASNTATVLTPGIAWDTAPNATSTFVILYRLSDVVANVPTYAAWNVAADSKLCEISTSIRLLSGGALSLNRETMLFTTAAKTIQTEAGSYFQAGRQASAMFPEIGLEGGTINAKGVAGYWDIAWAGKMKLYGTNLDFIRVAVDTLNAATVINDPIMATSTGLAFYSCNINALTLMLQSPDIAVGCKTMGHTMVTGDDCAFSLPGSPVRFSGNTGGVNPRCDRVGSTINGGDVIDHVSAVSGTFDFFAYLFNLAAGGIVYFWNSRITNAWTALARWYANTGTGHMYRGYLVGLKVADAAGAALAGVNVGVYDVNGDGAILTGKAADKTPVRTAMITTNASGSYTGIVGVGEGLPLLYARYTKASEYVSTELLYMPGTLRARLYGKRFFDKVANYTERSKEQPTLADNTFTVALGVVAAAYTGITANAIAKTLITSEAHTLQQVYDSSQSWAATDTSYDEPLTTSDGLTLTLATGWKFTPDLITWDKRVAGGTIIFPAVGTYAPKVGITTVEFGAAGSYNFSGADIDNEITLTNSSGGAVTVSLPAGTSYVNVGPNITVSIPTGATVTFEGVVPGSEIRVYLPNKTEVAGVESCSANQMLSWDIETPPNNTVRVTIFLRGYRWHEFQLTPTVGSQAIPISQTADLGWTP